MKKEYSKPVFLMEKFALTQQIASCVTKIGFLTSKCVLDDPDSTPHMKDLAITGGFSECEIVYTPGQWGDKICYHTNVEAAFNS